MENIHSNKQYPLIKLSKCIPRTLFFFFFWTIIPIFFTMPCFSQQKPDLPEKDVVNLWSKKVVLTYKTTEEFIQALKSAQRGNLHGVIQLKKIPTIEERKKLEEKGLMILNPIQNTFYDGKVSKKYDHNDRYVRSLVQSLYLMKPHDKVRPDVWEERYDKFIVNTPEKEKHNYVLNQDGTLNLTVQFYKSVSSEEINDLLKRHTIKYNKLSDTYWQIVIKKGDLKILASEDRVRMIDVGLVPFLPDLDTTRHIINVEDVQNFNIASGLVQGIGGQGVQVGIFEGRGFDETHDDFGTRVIVNDGIRGMHGTHVAGIVGASGIACNQNDSWGQNNAGAAFQWRGVAPEVDLIDSPSGNATDASEMLSYISTDGMDISNHSYSFSFDGNYGINNSIRDEAIRGDLTWNGIQIPGRLQVYSAGNHGGFPGNGGEQIGYFALTKQVKNALIVGNYDVANNRISEGSSLGPTHDGRIKPDVVAPGTDVISTAYCEAWDHFQGVCGVGCFDPTTGTVVVRQDFYLPCSGTSMAAPVVTGTVALVLEHYATTYGRNIDTNPPLPSTLRAIIIHSAQDISSPEWFENEDAPVQTFPGPDFVTGFGMVDAEGAIDIVTRRLIVEGIINNTCDKKTYRFSVGTNQTEPIKVTLAWDDVPGNNLQNDLDLELIDPNGSKHYPWLLDQTIFDQAGNQLSNDQQTCGTQLTIQRNLQPTPNPNFVWPNHPGNVNDPIQPGDLQPAKVGKDHVNNVEMVLAQPVPGIWQAVVTGFNVVQGPQRYSLIGFSPFLFDPLRWCDIFPFLCEDPIHPCKKYPFLCEPYVVFPGELGPIIEFRHMLDKIVIPLDKICLYVVDCPGCHDIGLCPGYEINFAEMPDNFGIEVFDSGGNSISRDISRKLSKTVKFRTKKEETYFLVISPGINTKIRKRYEIPLTVRMLSK